MAELNLHRRDAESAEKNYNKKTLRPLRRGGKIFICLLLLGLGLRVYGAWQLRHHLNPDSGLVALMAKHMAEGADFPVFFYGQAYMGALEPMISALFCKLFGVSGFMIALGTAFAGWLILPVVYLWARDAYSSRAGLIAMAYCVVGPLGFFHYQLSPRGGYAVTILLSALILWLAAKLIIDEHFHPVGPLLARGRISDGFAQARALQGRNSGKWFLLGLLAGLGWWTNQLIAGALISAALMGLFFLGRKIFSLNSFAAAAGFFAGSLPFWWWNVFNGWRSFQFAGSLGETPFLAGFKAFFLERLPGLLDLNHGPLAWRIILGICFLGAAVWAFGALLRAVKARQSGGWMQLLAILVFFLVSMLLFSSSHFARMSTARYLLPLVPAVAVILGVATAELSRKIPVYIALIPLGLIIISQANCLRAMTERGAGEAEYQRQIEECGRFLEAQGINACYTPYKKYAWNYALDERIAFCDLPTERYPPYMQRVELASRIAVIDNLGHIDYFVSNYGGSAKINSFSDVHIWRDFVPPREGLEAVAPGEIESIRDSLGRDAFASVTDGNLDTGWESIVARGDTDWLEIDFKSLQTVCMVRLIFCEYPDIWQIAGQGADGALKTLTPCLQPAGYLWSGPRPYWGFGVNGYRLECRFSPEQVKRLHIHQIQTGSKLVEMQIFGPAAQPAGEETALENLLSHIRERGIKRLYCDRWPANAVYRETKGAVQTSLDPGIFEGSPAVLGGKVWFTPRTGILIRREDEALCRQVLAGRLIAMQRTEIGPWVLLDFLPGKWKPEYGREFELEWKGFACLAKNNKRWAAELVSRADFAERSGEKSKAVALLEQACREWSFYQPAVERLAKLTSEKNNLMDISFSPGRAGFIPATDSRPRQESVASLKFTPQGGVGSTKTESEYWKSEQKKLQPDIGAEIKFAGGIEFAGISMSKKNVTAGEALTVRYFWKNPPGLIKNRPCVFVHFVSGENILQDDHLLSEFPGAGCQPYPELFIETRNLIVPENAMPGEYRMKLGLYDPSRPDLRRYKVQTGLPHRLNAVELPVTLTVTKRAGGRSCAEPRSAKHTDGSAQPCPP